MSIPDNSLNVDWKMIMAGNPRNAIENYYRLINFLHTQEQEAKELSMTKLSYRGIVVFMHNLPREVVDIFYDKDNVHDEDIGLLNMLHPSHYEMFARLWCEEYSRKEVPKLFEQWKKF